MNTSTLIRSAAALLLIAACSAASAAVQLQDVARPDASFQYAGEQDVWVQLAAYDVEGAPADLRSVEILDSVEGADQSRILDKGLTDATGSFERKVRVPAGTKQLTLRVGVLGITNTVTLALDGSGVVSHTFE